MSEYEEEYPQQEEINTIKYKIVSGREYTISRQDFNGKTFYSIPLKKNNQDGTEVFGKKIVRFRNGIELQDKTRIKIISAFEDFYQKDRYNTMFTLFITEFEITGQPESVINEAYNEFNNDNNLFELPF